MLAASSLATVALRHCFSEHVSTLRVREQSHQAIEQLARRDRSRAVAASIAGPALACRATAWQQLDSFAIACSASCCSAWSPPRCRCSRSSGRCRRRCRCAAQRARDDRHRRGRPAGGSARRRGRARGRLGHHLSSACTAAGPGDPAGAGARARPAVGLGARPLADAIGRAGAGARPRAGRARAIAQHRWWWRPRPARRGGFAWVGLSRGAAAYAADLALDHDRPGHRHRAAGRHRRVGDARLSPQRRRAATPRSPRWARI